MIEVWKDITGFEGIYKVSSLGNVISFRTNRGNVSTIGKPMTGYIQDGYKMIHLRNGEEHIRIFLHNLVAEYFIDDYNSLDRVMHINGNKLDNRLENLELIKHNDSDLEGEIWKDVPDYEGVYQASNKGRIKSMRDGRIIKPLINKVGYAQFHIIGTKPRKNGLVHRFVASAFYGKPKDNRNCVNHINSNPSDNTVENLEWCTYKENSQHAVKFGRLKGYPTWKGKFGKYHNRSKDYIGKNKEIELICNCIGDGTQLSLQL